MSNAKRYSRLGREVARQVGPGPGEERKSRQRQAFRAMTLSSRKVSSRSRLIVFAAAVAAVIVLGTFLLIRELSPGEMSFWVGTETNSGREGEWLRAPADDRLPFRFEDGTRMELHAKSTVRVLAAERERVVIELGQGTIKASVNKEKTKSSWTISAGNYSVAALGTTFEVTWKPESNFLAVKVWKGKVILHGGGIQEQGIVLDTNEHLVIGEDGRRIISRLRGSEPVKREEIELGEIDLAPGESPGPERAKVSARHPPARRPEEVPSKGKEEEDPMVASLDRGRDAKWQEYYDLRMYKEFLAEAERRGLKNLYETLDEPQLWQLANSARYVKRSEVAVGALQSLRSRFQDSSKAPVAVFLLGRLSSENLDDQRAACNWFHVYLQEYPGGNLEEESLGRSIDACWKAGMKSRAKRAAKTYIKSYPKGSFSELAASILSK